MEPREGVRQVREAAERVAKGHDGHEAVRKAQALWTPGEAMAKLWETLKSLEGSAENRDAKLEERNFLASYTNRTSSKS